jgi:uncharacterized coiled-coil DUF342 family protein
MTKKEIDFVKTINWIQHNLELDLKEGEVEDHKKRLFETVGEIKKALKDLNDSY